ncbi:MAG TPA: thiamine pyrophosphate-dependent enzyme, partial [Actinomycetospora sp.]|nr:thiamine pyrophosphate-dependent enzyme [Actinomycetospora sp.]
RAVGAVPERVHSAASAVADTVRAFRIARQQRRTVLLNLPLDVQAQPCPDPPRVEAIEPWGPSRPDTASVASLAAILSWAKRPVFVAGRGARGAGPEVAALADVCGALLATSAVAHGLFADSPWSLGICGGFATPLAAELVAEADVVVAWGASLTMWTTRHGALISADATVVQVDDDPAALGAHHPVDLGVCADVAATAGDVAVVATPSPGYRSPDLAARIRDEGRWALLPVDDTSTEERIDPRVLSAHLDALLPAARTVATDSGNFMGYPAAYLAVPDTAGFCFTQAFQSVGLGLATALGAAIARPDRLTVAALGDGGFLMGVAELETASRLGLPLLVVVYDDAAYGAEVHHFAGADHTTVTFPDRDLAAIGRGFGCEGLVVRSVDDLAGVSAWLDGPRERPLVVDAKVVADEPSWWLAEAFRGH